jgi:tetraacyldisaccharide 4'-kinase
LRRADCIVLTRTSGEGAAELIDRIQRVTNAPIFQSRTLIDKFRRFDASGVAQDTVEINQPLAAFCGIGNPSSFFQQLRAAHLDVRHEAVYRDHHKYSQVDIDRLAQHAQAKGAQALITTAKDSVKLQSLHFELACYVAQMEVEISDATKLLELVEQAITQKKTS